MIHLLEKKGPLFRGTRGHAFILPLGNSDNEVQEIHGLVLYRGDEILPSYMGIVIHHEIRIPINQSEIHGMSLVGFEPCSSEKILPDFKKIWLKHQYHHHIFQNKSSQQIGWCGFQIISWLFLWNMCVIFFCLDCRYVFFLSFPGFWNEKVTKIRSVRPPKAARERHTAATRCNDRSSRSHAVFQLLWAAVFVFCFFFGGGGMVMVFLLRGEQWPRAVVFFCCIFWVDEILLSYIGMK